MRTDGVAQAFRRAAAAGAVMIFAACAAAPRPASDASPSRGPAPSAETPEVEPSPGIGTSPGIAVRVGDAEPAPPRPVLRLVRREAKRGDGFEQLGLSRPGSRPGLRLRAEVPETKPAYVPHRLDGLDLMVADSTADGWLALYRTPLAEWAGTEANGRYRAILFGPGGARRWDVDLARLLSRPYRLEIQDIRYADGRLYYNEACQSYSDESAGRCSALVRVDPATQRVEWRTRPLVSNNVLLVHGRWVIAGYGFTREPDFLHVVDRETGEVLLREPLDSAHSHLEVRDGRLYVITYNSVYVFALTEG